MEPEATIRDASDRQYRDYGYASDEPEHTHAYLWPLVLKLLPANGGRVFDAGCGNGAFARRLSERGFDVAGADLSESGVEQARRACPAGSFAVASVTDDLQETFSTPFDVIVALEVIEHLYDPRSFASNMFKMTRPGGVFIVSTPYHGYLKNLLLAATNRLDAHFTALWPGGHIKFWSRRTLSSLLEQAGYRIEAFRGAGRVPWFWKSMVIVARRPAS